MRKLNVFFFLLLGAMVSFTSCSSDDDVTPLTPEEQEAKDKLELIQKASDNFEMIVSKKWTIEAFIPSSDLLASSKTEDGATALTIMKKSEQVINFNLGLTFTKEGELYKSAVEVNVPEADLEVKLIAYQDALAGFEAGFLYDTKEYYLSSVRRIILAPFAADDKEISDIVNEDTGDAILTIQAKDFSTLSYEDAVLSSRKLIEGNSDKVYFNEEGKLVVEVTSEEFGTSNWVLTEVAE